MKNEQAQIQNANQIVSIPNSLRGQLERADLLLEQGERAAAHGDHQLAVVKAQEAMRVVQRIASSAPELTGLTVLADMSCQGFEYETVERVNHGHLVERTFFGIGMGH